ncbi:unnamed protein product [Moneuplotes crassus]|uniref:Uncharacterized protein n=1 Tax=Euplotes crassus TaxID=5936 RepID=A0AAD1XI49_EUPCR|nr:unnamed protein product [Moneuplotes crassus]
MRRRGFGGGFGMRRRPMMMAPMMMMPRRRVVVVNPPPKKKKTKIVYIHGPPPPGHQTTTTTVVHHPPAVEAQGIQQNTHTNVSMGVPVGSSIPMGQPPGGLPESSDPMPPSPVQIPGEPHGVQNYPPIGSEPSPEESISQCKSCGAQFNSNEAHLHKCLLCSNPGKTQDTNDLEHPYDPEMTNNADMMPRRNSIEHPGANQTGDLTQSLLPDKVIKKTLLSDQIYMQAWVDLNVGFLDRFKKIQASFRTRKLGFWEHVRGKKWKNIKKLCPPIKYPEFLSNHNIILTTNIEKWLEINHQYLIREVESLPKKDCSFCGKKFELKKDVALLPCLDLVHYKCLKSKFRGFLFIRQKDSTCACELNLQEMYESVKTFLDYT